MKTILARFCRTAAFLLMGASVLFTFAAANPWKSGRVIEAGINGHGRTGNAKIQGTRYKDMWWNYCISSGDEAYSVLSRENPSHAGLKENSEVRFLERKDQIFVLNPAGKRIGLKILRKDKGQRCP